MANGPAKKIPQSLRNGRPGYPKGNSAPSSQGPHHFRVKVVSEGYSAPSSEVAHHLRAKVTPGV